MKRRETQSAAHWSGAPSLTERWLGALLRLAAMCLVSLARLAGFKRSIPTGECDARPDRMFEPATPSDPITKETHQAAHNSSRTTAALILSRCASARRPSKDEGGLTAARDEPIETHQHHLDPRPLIPAKAGTQGRRQGLSRITAAARRRNKPLVLSWIPAFAGTSG